jgi:hypothetical protein
MTEPVSRAGEFYAVEPVLDEEQDTFPPGLDGLCGKHGAIVRAIARSAGGHTVLVTRTTADGKTRRVREFRDGAETWRSGVALIPPPDRATPPPAVVPVRGLTLVRGNQSPKGRRGRTRDKVSWPGLRLVAPPCED